MNNRDHSLEVLHLVGLRIVLYVPTLNWHNLTPVSDQLPGQMDSEWVSKPGRYSTSQSLCSIWVTIISRTLNNNPHLAPLFCRCDSDLQLDRSAK